MKKIIIVGASSGLGARIATDFARGGCLVGSEMCIRDRLRAVRKGSMS